MATTVEILAAEGRDIKLPGETVHVGEMPWTDTLAVLQSVSEFAGQFIQNGEDGSSRLVLSDLIAFISKSDKLAGEIVSRSTGKTIEWVGAQSPRAVLAILDAAIDVNMSDEVKNLGKAVGRRFGFGAADRTQIPNSAT